jgi:hypothetical protein
MTKRRTPRPMETQPLTHWLNAAAPMGQAPSSRSKRARPSRPPMSEAKAETTRRRSLEEQRSQLEKGAKQRDELAALMDRPSKGL